MERKHGFNPKTICSLAIAVLIVVVLFSVYAILNEYYTPRNTCESLNKTFEYNFPSEFLCDNKPFFKYSNGEWDFSRDFSSEVNLSLLFLP